jgi:virginiamycin A acetyltransferase
MRDAESIGVAPRIERSQIGPNCHVAVMAEVLDSNLAECASVYRMARVQDSTLGVKAYVGDSARCDHSRLADHVRINRFNHVCYARIGRRTYTGPGTIIMHAEIGAFSSIAWGVTIGPAEHDFRRVTSHSFLYNDHDGLRPPGELAYDRFAKPCVIGNDVWIGAQATVLRGVRVGDGAVIGAHALVTRDVPPYTIVAGVPARVRRTRFDPELAARLQALAWWRLDDDRIREHYALFCAVPSPALLDRLEAMCRATRQARA